VPIDHQLAGYPPVTGDPPLASESFPVSEIRRVIDPNDPPWGFAMAFLVWVLSIAVQFVMQIILLAFYLIYAGWNPSSPDAAQSLTTLTLGKTGVFLQIFALLPAHILTFAMVWAVVTRFGKYPFLKTIGWEWPSRVWTWLSVVLGFVLFGAGVAIAKIVGADTPTFLEQIINSSAATRYTIAFLATFTAPFVEEFIYRGVLFAALQRLAGAVVAGVATLFLFTLIHVPQYWPNLGVLAAVGFLSVALTVIRAKTGRLLPCVVIHFVFNGIQSAYLLIEPYLSNPQPVPEPAPSLFIMLQLGLF
jgi:membrane protease YdiL (CAAX protease family)